MRRSRNSTEECASSSSRASLAGGPDWFGRLGWPAGLAHWFGQLVWPTGPAKPACTCQPAWPDSHPHDRCGIEPRSALLGGMTTGSALPGRTLAVSLGTAALLVSVPVLALMVMRPAWLDAISPEALLTTSVAVVPTLLVGAVLALLAPTLRGTRAVPRVALALAALGFGLLAVATVSWSEAFDAADEGLTPSALARMFPVLAAGALLSLWASLSTIHYQRGAQPHRPFHRGVAAASTGIALTIAATALALSPPAPTMSALGFLVFTALYTRAGQTVPRAVSPATPRA
jgi:peptidoglycan/LPS O-acetylase OafA/YrhL